MRFFTKQKNKAFTLVETLVAISILMMAITGPLYFASNSLKAATYARDQITAFYLAQDAFEQVRAIRDNNTINAVTDFNWLEGLQDCIGNNCYMDPFSTPVTSCTGQDGECGKVKLNKSTGQYGYAADSDTNWADTIFTRTIKILTLPEGEPDPKKTTEAKVTVTISWTSAGIVKKFEAFEFIRAQYVPDTTTP